MDTAVINAIVQFISNVGFPILHFWQCIRCAIPRLLRTRRSYSSYQISWIRNNFRGGEISALFKRSVRA